MMASEGKEMKGLSFHFNEVIKNQGVAGLYRGISTNVCRAMVLNATKMSIFDSVKVYG